MPDLKVGLSDTVVYTPPAEFGQAPRAAIVIAVHDDDTVDLTTYPGYAQGTSDVQNVPLSELDDEPGPHTFVEKAVFAKVVQKRREEKPTPKRGDKPGQLPADKPEKPGVDKPEHLPAPDKPGDKPGHLPADKPEPTPHRK